MAIFGINGKISSGKDTIGSIIQYLVDKDRAGYQHPDSQEDFISYCINFNPKYCKWKVKKFAGKLKEIAALLTGCTIEQLEDQEFKKQPLGFDWSSGHCVGASSTYRELLQLLGTEIMRDKVHPNVWVNALMADYKAKWVPTGDSVAEKDVSLEKEYPNWIITDMRFPNEIEAVKAKDGITIRVNRLYSTTGENGIPATFSQTQFHPSETSLDNHEFDYVIDNNGTIEDLIQKVKVILVKESIIK